MSQTHLNSIYKDVIGVKDFLNRLNGFYETRPGTAFPPYNIIEKEDGKTFIIELAVAGFDKSEITISNEDNNLTIIGEKKNLPTNDTYIYNGIAGRNFERKFLLQENVVVNDAGYDNGILSIRMERIEPKREKLKLIKIS